MKEVCEADLDNPCFCKECQEYYEQMEREMRYDYVRYKGHDEEGNVIDIRDSSIVINKTEVE